MKKYFLWMFLWPITTNSVENYYSSQDHFVNIIKSNVEPINIKHNISIYAGNTFADTYPFIPIFAYRFSNTSNTKFASTENVESFLMTFKQKNNNDVNAEKFATNTIFTENKILHQVSLIWRKQETSGKATTAKSILLMSNGHDMLKIEADTYTVPADKTKKLLSHENIMYRINNTQLLLKRDIEHVLHTLKKYRVGMKIKDLDLSRLQEVSIEVFRDTMTNIRYYMIHYYRSHEYGECGKKKDFNEREYIVFIIGIDNFDKIIYLSLMNNCCEEINV